MSFTKLLNTTMDVGKVTYTQNAVGGPTETWVTLYRGLACRIRLLKDTERTISGREGEVSTHRVYCDSGITVTAKNRLTISSTTYDVIGVNKVQDDSAVHHIELDVILRA